MAAEITPTHELEAGEHVVLLVEDEPIIRFDIADELRHLGFQVVEAANADDAIDVLRSTARIDIVLTDVRMPGARDGLDVARAVREKRPRVKTIVMSGHLVAMEQHKLIIDRFVSKPAASDRLATIIFELLHKDHATREG